MPEGKIVNEADKSDGSGKVFYFDVKRDIFSRNDEWMVFEGKLERQKENVTINGNIWLQGF